MPQHALISEGARRNDIESEAIRGAIAPDIITAAPTGTYQALATTTIIDSDTTAITLSIRLKPAERIGDRRIVCVTPGAAVTLTVYPPTGESFANDEDSFSKTTTAATARSYVFRQVQDGVWSVPTE